MRHIYHSEYSVWVRYPDTNWSLVKVYDGSESMARKSWNKDILGPIRAGNSADYQLRHYYRDKEHGAGHEVIADTLASERN